MRFIDSGNMLVQRHTVEVPVAQYKEFFIYLSGTNAGGATTALTDMNNIRINRNGMDFINVNIDNLASLSDLLGGMIANASAIGAAFEFGFHIPFSFPGFQSVMSVNDEDICKLHFDFGNLAALVASGTWTVYGILETGIERYLPIMVQDSVALAAANNQEKRKAPVTNVHSVYAFPNTAANFAKLTVERDDQIMYDGNYDAGQVWTNLYHRKEAAAIEVAHVPVAVGFRPDELLSETIYVTPLSQTGALTVEFVYFASQFDPKAISNSRQTLDSRVTANVNKKQNQGKGEEARTAISVAPEGSVINEAGVRVLPRGGRGR